ncbi:7-cyano-7-deazaguanine synthase QueC [Bacillus cereus]|nr:7-cyano-7-deazaguanine synthase QueC [Bacillus cereus]
MEALTFNYNQRNKSEIECAVSITKELNIKHHVFDMSLLSQVTSNALTRKNIDITDKQGELPSTFVDGRNLLFLSFAAVVAKQFEACHIVTGVCETDFSDSPDSVPMPDCRDVFVKSLNVTLNLSMDYPFVIHTPLMWMDKAETWKLADELGAFEFIREKTLTCYNGVIGDGCRECPACQFRKAGLDRYIQKRKGEKV